MRQLVRATRHGKVLLAFVGIVGITACGADAVTPPESFPMSVDIFTPGSVFSPPTADIARGGTVRFFMTEAPDGDGHNAIFNRTGAPIDIPVVKDTVISRTFSTVGTFPYLCTVHPGMVGEIIVH